MSESTPLGDPDRVLNLQQELQTLLDDRSDVLRENQDPYADPFQEMYTLLADMILTASNMYIGLRNLEDMIREALSDDAQDS